MFRFRLLTVNAILLLALLGSYWGRRIEDAPTIQTDFLKGLNLPFRNLKTSDTTVSDDERVLLQPDAVLVRRYLSQAGAVEVELAIIAGHHKKSVHTPAFCMAGGGWDTLWQQQSTITLADRSIPAMQMLMAKDGNHMLVTYFFTNGDYCTRNLIQFQGAQFLSRLHADIREGALVRILVPIANGEDAAKLLTDEFGRAVIPAALANLREVRIPIQ